MSINPLNDISRVYLEQVAAVEEGVRPTPVDKPLDKTAFKKRRRSLAGKEKSAEARGRGHEGKEWYNSGRTYSPDEAKRMRSKLDDAERRTRHRSAVDPDDDNDNNYSADKTKNPKKIRKQKAMGELGESAVPGKPAERLGAVTAIPKSEQDAARERLLAKTKAKREKMKNEALDPVGQEDSDIDNDGDTDKSDKYLHKRRKAIGKAIAKNRVTKESFSNWRHELFEVMDDDVDSKPIKEKKIENKVKINPDIKESVEDLGGFLIEMVEIDEVDYIVESVYNELLDEGYEEDDIEEAIEYALTEATVTYGHDTDKPYQHQKKSGAGRLIKAVGRLARQKLSSKVGSVKKSARAAVVRGARKVAKGALGVARKIEGEDSKVNPRSKGAKPTSAPKRPPSAAGTRERVSSGSYTPPTEKKAEKPADPWKGSSTVPQKPKPKPKPKAEKPSDPWEGSATTPSKEKPKAAKPKATAKPKPAAPKATTKTTKVTGGTTRPPAKKKKSKLDDLLASVRSESANIGEQSFDINSATHRQQQRIEKATKLQQATKGAESSAAGSAVKRLGGSGISLPLANSYELEGNQIDEKTLTKAEKRKREELVKKMKKNLPGFEDRYPGRGKEVMYATATKMSKKLA